MNQFFKIGIVKTLWFNFAKLPFKQALRLPVILARNVTVIDCRRGCFEFDRAVTGCVTIGLNRCGNKGAPSSIRFYGKVIIRGVRCHAFGAGCHISVARNAVFEIGDGFGCTGDITISVAKSMVIGADNLWSYNCAVMDNDGHMILHDEGKVINLPRGVVFGDHVWMGNGCIILKGAEIADGCIIAAGSRIAKKVADKDCIITSDGKVLKQNISWKR